MTEVVRIEIEFDDGSVRRLTGEKAHRWLEVASDLSVTHGYPLKTDWEKVGYHTESPQFHVAAWVRETFGNEAATNIPERALRTAEEALELAQACDVDAETLHRLVDYVFSRPVGVISQEIGGCMVTLYAMAAAVGTDADTAFEVEIDRIHRPEVVERCRRRQHEKSQALVTGK